MRYNSTRNNDQCFSASECIIKGLADDGGLFIPKELDGVHFDYNVFIGKHYSDIAQSVLGAFMSDFTPQQIAYCARSAYNTAHFETDDIFTLKDIGTFGYLELFRGQTVAFKDAALSVMPYLMQCAKENTGEKRTTVILTATSGDTGKAALEGFKDADGIQIIVFYPYGGVSQLQLMQMLTQEGANTSAVAVRGNFDTVQSAVKRIFTDGMLKERGLNDRYFLSSANSINISRLIPQIVYYYYAYVKAIERGRVKTGETVNFVVPTGNFGNILAGYYAMRTGLPVKKLICASNENNVLTDFFLTGRYDKNRPFKKTISPSMDILISSNLERLIYEMTGKDDAALFALMQDLSRYGAYATDKNSAVFDAFYGGYATEAEIRAAIKKSYEKYGYVIDTHTACGYKVYQDYVRETQDGAYAVILSTASPYKFSQDVLSAISGTYEDDGVKAMHKLSALSCEPLPTQIAGIEKKPMKKETVIDADEMENTILSIINGEARHV